MYRIYDYYIIRSGILQVLLQNFAGIAQLVEQRIRNAQVVGSSPIPSSIEVFPVRWLSELFGGDFCRSKSRHEFNALCRIFTYFFVGMGVSMGVKFTILTFFVDYALEKC